MLTDRPRPAEHTTADKRSPTHPAPNRARERAHTRSVSARPDAVSPAAIDAMTTIVARAGKDPDQLLAALGHANWADAPREQVRRLTERAVQDIEARQVRAAMRRLARASSTIRTPGRRRR